MMPYSVPHQSGPAGRGAARRGRWAKVVAKALLQVKHDRGRSECPMAIQRESGGVVNPSVTVAKARANAIVVRSSK